MILTNLQGIATAVVRRAQRQGSVLPREVRDELTEAGLDATLWKDVVALARPALRYRQGRYHYVPVLSSRAQEEQRQQQAIGRAIRQLVRAVKKATPHERRQQGRCDFIQPVKVQTEDGREFTLLSRDISPTGIRLIGTRSLLGQKVQVSIAPSDGAEPWSFLVRILWTCAVGDDLYENGGSFLELTTRPESVRRVQLVK